MEMALAIEYFNDILNGWEKEKNQFNRKKKSLNDIAFKYYSCFGILERFLEQKRSYHSKNQIIG